MAKARDLTKARRKDAGNKLKALAGQLKVQAQLQGALDGLSNIGGIGGSTNVTQVPVQEIEQFSVIGTQSSDTFTLTFQGLGGDGDTLPLKEMRRRGW